MRHFSFSIFCSFCFFLDLSPIKKKKDSKDTNKTKENDSPGALFIPAGVLTGMGIGFFLENIAGAMFTGLGIGFIFFALCEIFLKKNK